MNINEKLFTEFPPVATEQWENTIVKDLKGADYNKKLVWKTDEGFSVRPYYRAEAQRCRTRSIQISLNSV